MTRPTDEKPLETHNLPIAPPERDGTDRPAEGAPDLHIEEIEEKHVPKDRNIFDK